MSGGRLIRAIDELYRRAVVEAREVDDASLAAWLEDLSLEFEERPPKRVAGALRKSARNARRLAGYWRSDDREAAALPDWRNGVDEVLGGAGWRPHLDLARHRLATDPSPEAFDAVKTWFRAVHFVEWMEGVTYEEWLDDPRRAR